MAKNIPIPKKEKTHRPISLLPALSKVMERFVLARVQWSSQPINQYALGFRSGVGTIDTIATGNIESASTSRSLVRIPVSNESLYHATQEKNHGYSTSISMPTTRALIRAGIDSDVDQHRWHVCSKAATTRGVV